MVVNVMNTEIPAMFISTKIRLNNLIYKLSVKRNLSLLQGDAH